MNKIKICTILITIILLTLTAHSQVNFGADLVSRYVWRGTDFGNSASIQPTLAFSFANFEIGAWGSYALTAAGAGANENDLYAMISTGPASFTLTDYYFPEKFDFFNYSDDDGIHIIEISASVAVDKISLMGAVNISGDPDNSFYGEIGYIAFEKDDLSVGITAGVGTKSYIADPDGDFNFVNLGVTASKGALFTSYIINPEAETNFLVFGYSF